MEFTLIGEAATFEVSSLYEDGSPWRRAVFKRSAEADIGAGEMHASHVTISLALPSWGGVSVEDIETSAREEAIELLQTVIAHLRE